ncbi:MAG: ABC transporter ATP-binding protein [Bacteroidales bacterium]|nr:ABC transporter ATP-binding protein [Bacteroidales bacterium]
MKLILKDVNKTYLKDGYETDALKGLSIEINRGDQIMIVGPSGSGKSTLLNIIGLLDRDYEGSYLFDNHEMKNVSEHDLSKYRNKTFAYIFQDYLLLENETIYDNVVVPLLYSKTGKHDYQHKVMDILTKVGLHDISNKKVKYLSGGERQRVAIARSLVNGPDIILADEPTGSLDANNREIILDILYDYVSEGKTLLFVTHDLENNRRGNQRVIEIREGILYE